MRQAVWISILLTGLCLTGTGLRAAETSSQEAEPEDYRLLGEIIATEFSGQVPHEWGETVSGVQTRLKTEDKVLALGVDICDLTDKGAKLVRFLAAEKVPAVLFVCGTWIDENGAVLKKLAEDPLFEIANRGISRKSCSVNGRVAEGAPGTAGAEDLFHEIERNARKIETATGTLPRYYYAGGGYYDEIAVRVIKALGYEALGSSVHLPEGSGVVKKQVLDAFADPVPGAIAIVGGTPRESSFVEGVMESVRTLRSRGYQFVKISDYLPA